MQSSDDLRRQTVLVHTVLAASLGVYGLMLLMIGSPLAGRSPLAGATNRPPPSPRLLLVLSVIGIVQFAFASWVGRTILRSSRSPAGERVRRAFLLRGAAAEAIGLYGLLAGLLRAPALAACALFALSAAALLVSAPTRSAWDAAMRATQSPAP